MQDILLSVITGAIGSFLVVFTLFRLKPKVVISKEIAKDSPSPGKIHYSFKVINKTPYPLYDIKIQLVLITPENVSNGTIQHAEPLMTLDLFEMESGKNQLGKFENEITVVYTNNLEHRWNDSTQHICLYVFSKHSFSQFSKVEKQIYYKKSSSIKNGHFPNGELNVVI